MAGTPSVFVDAKESGDVSANDEVLSIAPELKYLSNDKNALAVFTNSLPSQDVDNSIFYWQKSEIIPNNGTTGASAASAASGATADLDLSGDTTASYWTAGDILKFPATGHIYRVNGIPSTATAAGTVNCTCLSAVTSTIASGAHFRRIGNAFQEGSVLIGQASAATGTPTVNSLGSVESQSSNYTQTFRTGMGLTRREMKMKKYSGDSRTRARLEGTLKHTEEIENALWHGVSGTEANGRTRTGGVLSFVPAGNKEAITTLTEDELDDFIRHRTRYVQDAVMWTSRFGGQTVSQLARDAQRIQTPGTENKWGVAVTEYLAGVGEGVKFVQVHALEGIPGSTAAPSTWDGYMALLPASGIELKKFGGCFMEMETDVHPKDYDGAVDGIKSDIGLEMPNDQHMGLITGITG